MGAQHTNIDTTTHVYKQEPIELVNPVKQGLFDYIITYAADATTNPMSLVDPTPMLVRGDYDTLYKKLMNNELILGCWVSVDYIDGTPTSQNVALSSDIPITIYKNPDPNTLVFPTISGKPVLRIGDDMLIDCHNNHYYPVDAPNIPFDNPTDEK